MKLDKYILPFILTLLGFIFYFSFTLTFNSVTTKLVKQQVDSAKNQATLIAKLLEVRLENGASETLVLSELQKSITDFSTANSFVCLFDNTGKEICHPNKERIGKTISENNSVIHLGSNFEIENNFKEALKQKKTTGGIRKMERRTEIVYLSPVKNRDWIVASHSNIEKHRSIINDLKEKLLLIFIIIWLVSSLIIFFFIDFLNKKSLQKLAEDNETTSEKYFRELKLMEVSFNQGKKEKYAERLLVDKGAKLSPVFMNEIAYIFTQNRITYIYEHNGDKSTINLTLDELFKVFDKDNFYRVSRQVILSVKSIDKIEKQGNTQLKVTVKPISPIDIVISKAKLTEFKKWAGKN